MMRQHVIKRKGDLFEIARTEVVSMGRQAAEAHLHQLNLQLEDCDRGIDRLREMRVALIEERDQLAAQLQDK